MDVNVDWMQWLLSRGYDDVVNEALRKCRMMDMMSWLDRYGKKRGRTVWEVCGKEVRCQPMDLLYVWFFDGKEVSASDSWDYLYGWLLEQILEAGIVVSS
jgi:hypothetical protein